MLNAVTTQCYANLDKIHRVPEGGPKRRVTQFVVHAARTRDASIRRKPSAPSGCRRNNAVIAPPFSLAARPPEPRLPTLAYILLHKYTALAHRIRKESPWAAPSHRSHHLLLSPRRHRRRPGPRTSRSLNLQQARYCLSSKG